MANNRKNCWFQKLLERNGKDYIDSGRLTWLDVNQNVDRIINDIINDKIDYNVYGRYLLNPLIFDTLFSYCRNRLSNAAAIRYSLQYVDWQMNIGNIAIANSSMTPGMNYEEELGDAPIYQYDIRLLNQGTPTITQNMASAIRKAIRDVDIEYHKYLLLVQYLDQVYATKNVYILADAYNTIRPYLRNTSNIKY